MKNYLKIIKINEYSITPKYLQIYNSVLNGIQAGLIVIDDVLPSINDLSFALEVGRNTIERAYRDLKKFGVVDSVAGKGYFICNVQFDQPLKVLLLFNKLSNHKKIIYDAFAAQLGASVALDFYIYNNDFNIFKKLLDNKVELYAKVVVIPHFFNGDEHAYQLINSLPKEKLVLVDKLLPDISGDFCAVYEDFERDIFGALEELKDKLAGYHTLKILFPANSYYSKSILTGFINFCVTHAFDYEILSNLKNEALSKGTVYINLMEDDLVELVQKIIAGQYQIGEDIGVISYNETPLKQIILSGITTISTDFVLMGEKAAEMVLSGSNEHFAVPFKTVLRKSL
jgi:DNA-binding transcriptional regulator YhcF (GntR family)